MNWLNWGRKKSIFNTAPEKTGLYSYLHKKYGRYYPGAKESIRQYERQEAKKPGLFQELKQLGPYRTARLVSGALRRHTYGNWGRYGQPFITNRGYWPWTKPHRNPYRYFGSQSYRNRVARRRYARPYRRRYIRPYKRSNYRRKYSYYNSLYRTYNRRYQIRKKNRYYRYNRRYRKHYRSFHN